MEIKEYLQIFKKRIFMITVTPLIFAAISAVFSILVIKPVYKADVSLYVGKQVSNIQSAAAYNDIMISTQLVKDYRELVKSRLVINTVAEQLQESKIHIKSISDKISDNLKNDTRLIQITVEDEVPYVAKEIADNTAAVFKEKAEELMDVENVRVIDRAQLPAKPFKPNKLLNIILSFTLGSIIGIGTAFLIEYLDNKIKTAEDVKKYCDISVIGSIPFFESIDSKAFKTTQSKVFRNP